MKEKQTFAIAFRWWDLERKGATPDCFTRIYQLPKARLRRGYAELEDLPGGQGFMYSANNEGLLTFDGIFWKKHTLPEEGGVRSPANTRNGRLYINAQDKMAILNQQSMATLNTPLSMHAFPDLKTMLPTSGRLCRSTKRYFSAPLNKFSGSGTTKFRSPETFRGAP